MTTKLQQLLRARKAAPAPTAQEVQDETARRIRTAGQRGNTDARVRGNMPDLMQFVGSRREVNIATLNKPRLRGNNNGGFDGYSGDVALDEKAARIATVATDPTALPRDRMEAADWVRGFVKKTQRVAALKAAGEFFAGVR